MELHSPTKEQLGDEAPQRIAHVVRSHEAATRVTYLCGAILFITLLIVLAF